MPHRKFGRALVRCETQKGRKFATTNAIENVFEAFKMRLNVAQCIPLPCWGGSREAKGYTNIHIYVDIYFDTVFFFFFFFFWLPMRLCWARWWCICNVHECMQGGVQKCVWVCVWACGFAKMHPAVGCLHLTIKQLVRGAKSICNCVCLCVCNFWACFNPTWPKRTRNPNCKINHTR